MELGAFKEQHLQWLAMEEQAEREDTLRCLESMSRGQLQKTGLAILGLYPGECKTCLGGRISVDFHRNADLPRTLIKTGDIVKVECGGAGGPPDQLTGTVHRLKADSITVIFEDPPELHPPVRLLKTSNPVAFSRMRAAIKNMSDQHPVVRMMYPDSGAIGYAESIKVQSEHGESIKVQPNDALNEEQNEAVRRAVQSRQLCIIHGPPGTGKTHCISHLLGNLTGKRVLIAAASNLAVDNIVERCPDLDILRIGHPTRLTDAVLHNSLDHALYCDDKAAVIKEVKKDIDKQLAQLKTSKHKRDIYRELKCLRAELRQREDKRLSEILDNASIIASTLSGCGSSLLRRTKPFDVVVIDEASQALEAECWIAVALAKKLVIVGDHKQLPPTVVRCSELQTTLFDRLIAAFPSVMLKRQYRMHKDIMGWSNRRFYNNLLIADESVSDHTLPDLPALQFIDTAGQGMWEQVEERSLLDRSCCNEHEAALVEGHVRALLDSNKDADSIKSIAVISPYSAQVDLLSATMEGIGPVVQIGTVDGFQGREADAVIVTLVRSNAQKEIGFLKESRRLNVALTRARRHLCIVGDSDTIRQHYGDLVKHLEDVGQVCAP